MKTTGRVFQERNYVRGSADPPSILEDVSRFGNHGTITGATWTKLPSGLWCLSFDGTDDIVDCGNGASLDLTKIIAFEAWINLDTLVQDGKILSQGVPSASGKWAIGPYDTADIIMLGVSANKMGLSDISAYLVAGKWQHWAVIYNVTDTTFTFFLDGVEQTLSNVGNFYGGTGTLEHLTYGASLDVGPSIKAGMTGDIAIARIYNRTPSALEIQNHFDREKHLFGV